MGPRPYWQHQERENRRWEYPLPHEAPAQPPQQDALHRPPASEPSRPPLRVPPREPIRLARSEGFGLPRLGDIPKPPPAQATAPAPAPQRAQQQAQPATGRVIDVFA